MCISDCGVKIEYEWMYVIIECYLYMNANAYRVRELYLLALRFEFCL